MALLGAQDKMVSVVSQMMCVESVRDKDILGIWWLTYRYDRVGGST
jgi:hypothetical protein